MTAHATRIIRTPDQRLRVFVSSTLQELTEERSAARAAINHLRLAPVMFELGARPHPPQDLYRAYLDQSHIFIGIYWQKYGWVAPDMDISGLEDEYNLSTDKPKLIYIKTPAPDREPRLKALLDRIRSDDRVSYKSFSTTSELRELVENDLVMLLTESFEATQPIEPVPQPIDRHPKHNLPVLRTSLVGRRRELDLVRNLLTRETPPTRLVTLTGPGGMGKTRLSLQVGAELIDHFPDGVYFVTLAPIADPDLIAPAIARTLDVREVPGRALIDHLKDYLRDKQLLLILDNFEQVIDGASLVASLLEACPHLKTLITSRMPLHVRGEKECPLPPLSLPRDDQLHGDEDGLADTLTQYAAINLFVERAKEVRPDFALTKVNALAIARICDQLDGLPLAIELAAARIKIMTPQVLLSRLASRLDVLKSGARDLPARQQTMREAIGWSYDLLNEQERILFWRLSVFVGGCTFEAVEIVCRAVGRREFDVFEQLSSLVDKSLVIHEELPNGEPRYRLLQTIRDYAREKLIEAGEVNTLQRQHANYFCQLAQQAEPYLISKDRAAWIDRLAVELDNLRAAIKWSRTADGEPELGLNIAGSLAWFWFMRGHMTEGRAWLAGAMACESPLSAVTSIRAKALYGASGLAWAQGDNASARCTILESVAIFRELGDKHWIAHALSTLALVALGQANPSEAREACDEGIALFREVGDQWGEAFTIRSLGDAALLSGDPVGARAKYEESIALWRKNGDPFGLAMPLNDLGRITSAQGDYAAACEFYRESGDLLRQVGNKWSLALVLMGLGYAMLHLNDLPQACAAFKEGLTIWRELGNRTGIIQCIAGFAGLAGMQHQPERAAQLFGAAEALFKSIGFPLEGTTRIEFERNVALACAQSDDEHWQAAWLTGQALTLDQAMALALA